MSRSRKYRSFGFRRENNLSEVQNKEEALNNLLNNLPGVDPEEGISFIVDDLEPIFGLDQTNFSTSTITQIAQSATRGPLLDEQGNLVFDEFDNPINAVVSPLVRLEDRIKGFRSITEDPPVFASGQGPKAFFIPSSLIPTPYTKDALLDTSIIPVLSDVSVIESDDFWMFGEFILENRINDNFDNRFGGIAWEGFFIPNPAASIHTFNYRTSGLFHVEYDRFGDGNWQILKSIYDKKRNIEVAQTSNSQNVTLKENQTIYLSVGDFLDTNNSIEITEISGDIITLSNSLSVSENDVLTFDMDLGSTTVTGSYTINEILDRAETPQMRKRIFWWFPDQAGYSPRLKYLNYSVEGQETFDYFFMNREQASSFASEGSIRELLENSVTPSQEKIGDGGTNRTIRSLSPIESTYIPPKRIDDIIVTTINITFKGGNRSATGSFLETNLGNYIVPTTSSELDGIIPKGIRIKELLGSNVSANSRLINLPFPTSETNYPVNIINHLGLVDYFIVNTSGNNVSIIAAGNTNRLKKDMICVSSNNGSDYIRISEITGPSEFITTEPLNVLDEIIFVYANTGILDKSLDRFCIGVVGQVLDQQANINSTTMVLKSIEGLAAGNIVQFGDSIQTNTSILSFNGNEITLSNPLIKTIDANETVVFAPANTVENKEICVLPLDLSPPFIGVDTGLDTDGKSIVSSENTFNLKIEKLTINQAIVTDVNLLDIEEYDSLIPTENGFSILANKIGN
jgi:hypothetical protein